jgi:hypothetical protein
VCVVDSVPGGGDGLVDGEGAAPPQPATPITDTLTRAPNAAVSKAGLFCLDDASTVMFGDYIKQRICASSPDKDQVVRGFTAAHADGGLAMPRRRRCAQCAQCGRLALSRTESAKTVQSATESGNMLTMRRALAASCLMSTLLVTDIRE